MNAEVFAKRLKKCRLLTRILGRNAENLDDYGCPKNQGLVKTDSLWICSSYLFRHKTRLQCAKRKAKVFITNLTLSTRRDFFYSIHFEKLSLRNR